MAPLWVCTFFDFPVSRFAYLSLVQTLLMRSGQGLSLGFSSLQEINEMDLTLACELRQLLTSSIEKIMEEQDRPGSGGPGSKISMRDTLRGSQRR
jgi:hypothetical protein